jgi:ribulose-phosphate 3-epimerase
LNELRFLHPGMRVCYASTYFFKRKRDLKHPVLIAPSILSANFARLGLDIQSAEEGGADLIHLDIMDGHFVPNITIGMPVVASIRKITRLPLDVHLMIQNPERHIDAMIDAGADWISVHVEADPHLNRTLKHLGDRGIRAGVALNPATPLGVLEEVLTDLDYVLIMSVNPGFGGQSFVPSALQKIRKLKAMITSNQCRTRIEVDGGIDANNLEEILGAGADTIVAGSAVFRAEATPAEAVRAMKEIAGRMASVAK